MVTTFMVPDIGEVSVTIPGCFKDSLYHTRMILPDDFPIAQNSPMAPVTDVFSLVSHFFKW